MRSSFNLFPLNDSLMLLVAREVVKLGVADK